MGDALEAVVPLRNDPPLQHLGVRADLEADDGWASLAKSAKSIRLGAPRGASSRLEAVHALDVDASEVGLCCLAAARLPQCFEEGELLLVAGGVAAS